MARVARQRSASGTYHILLRHNDVKLFKTDDDGSTFLSALKSEKKRDFMEVYAYCLFEGYAHIIVKEGLSGISNNIMRICTNYANYYNARYGHAGKIFRGRFMSEPLDDMAVILDATRYLHRLPLEFEFDLEYDFSSYKHYFKKSSLLSSDDIVSIIGSNIDYKIFCDNNGGRDFLAYKESTKKTIHTKNEQADE